MGVKGKIIKKYAKIVLLFLCAFSSAAMLGMDPLEEALSPFLPKVLEKIVTGYLPLADRLASISPTITLLTEEERKNYPLTCYENEPFFIVSQAMHNAMTPHAASLRPTGLLSYKKLQWNKIPEQTWLVETNNWHFIDSSLWEQQHVCFATSSQFLAYTPQDGSRTLCIVHESGTIVEIETDKEIMALEFLDKTTLIAAHATKCSEKSKISIWNLASSRPQKTGTIEIPSNLAIIRFKPLAQANAPIIALTWPKSQAHPASKFVSYSRHEDPEARCREHNYTRSHMFKISFEPTHQPAASQSIQPSSFRNFLPTWRWPLLGIGTISASIAACLYWWRKP